MNDLYERDFHAWISEQVTLLRAGKLDAADVANVAEEIATLGRSERRELRDRLAVLLFRLLKWRFQPGLRCGSAALSLEAAREEVAERLADNPSLKKELLETMMAAYRTARREAAIETGFALESFSVDCPWSFDQAMQDTP